MRSFHDTDHTPSVAILPSVEDCEIFFLSRNWRNCHPDEFVLHSELSQPIILSRDELRRLGEELIFISQSDYAGDDDYLMLCS